MSDPPLGRYHFLAWARRGVGASLTNPDGGALPSHAALSVQVALNVRQGGSTTSVLPTPMPVQLYGPGDVIGMDLRHVVRTDPRQFTPNFEPNYLCGLEFDTPDFPWLFTPAAPNSDRLRPWLALIVLKSDEFSVPQIAPNPLPMIDVLHRTALPDLADAWNWAHVQVSGDAALADVLSSVPGNAISRLLCPRRLDPETGYTVFLVPAFEIGRKAGLGEDVSSVATADPAWISTTPAPVRLPFYYRFEFHTSDAGDFESLVRRLTPRVLEAAVGQRPMDVSRPAPHIPSAGPPLGLEGALHSVSTVPTNWQDPAKSAFQGAAQTFINTPTGATDDPAHPNSDDPVVTPPIYGRWHAAVQSVDRAVPGWVNELNLDPRNRAAGGMGTQVVQQERTQLMASAWQQVDGIRAANQILKQAQLSRAALVQLYRQHIVAATPETVMTVTAPLHARLLASPTTVRSTIRASRVPERLLSPAFRRVTRPRRRIGDGLSVARRPALLGRVNSGELTIVPPPKPPNGLVSIEQVSDRQIPDWVRLLRRWLPLLLIALAILLLLVLIILALFAGILAVIVLIGVAALAAFLWPRLQALLQNASAADQLRLSGITPQAIVATPQQPAFTVEPPGTRPAPGGPTVGADSAQAAAFRSATVDLAGYFALQPTDTPQRPALDLSGLKTTVLTRIDPLLTVPRRAQAMINISTRLNWQPLDPLEPIMAAPEFPQPMYAPLRDLSPQYVLPGVELVPPDTLGLLLANHAFVEAYMVGLNHEMARQLLWNDYPTDQRGSYFRQFWDVSAYVRQSGDPSDAQQLAELLKDIPLVNTWPKPLPLGDHPNRADVVLNNVVLLVRGELFKRYPTAIVYAGKAKRAADGTRLLDETDERYPIFRGVLPNDITFLGFNLNLDDARGGTPESPEGFFFVFQEQPSEPRFGLEPAEQNSPVTLWADLAWTNFALPTDGAPVNGAIASAATAAFSLPDLGNTFHGAMLRSSPWRIASQVFSIVLQATRLPDFLSATAAPDRVAIAGNADNPSDPANNWGVNSAQTAYILLRLPFRVLIHADLLLPDS